MESGQNHLSFVDYGAIVVTLAGSLSIGLYFARKNQTSADLLQAGRTMGPLPVAASMMATYLSAIAILGFPSEIYYYGAELFTMTLLHIIVGPIAAYVFVPVFYNMKLTSIYKYLEIRFDSVVTRWIGATIGIIQMLFIMGVVLFAPSIALQQIVGIPNWVSIVGIGICGTIYTAVGGLKAVVWTDAFQLFIILICLASTIFAKAFSSDGGIIQAFEIASEQGRLKLFNFAVDPFMRHNTFNFVFGYALSMVCQTGTHHPQVQRYSTLPTLKIAQRAVLLSVPMQVITMGLLLVAAVVIFATYATCDPLKSGKIMMGDQILPYFVVNELSMIPGIRGLFISGIFSAVLSSVSSGLNSIAAVTWEDFLVRFPVFSNMKDDTKVNVTRLIASIFGVLMIGIAFVVQGLGPVISLVLSITGATAGTLGVIFLIGLFMPFVNHYGASAGMIIGTCATFYISYGAFDLGPQYLPLPTFTEGCMEGFIGKNMTRNIPEPLEWPEKIFTISYLMFPLIGAVITTTVGIVVSAVTGGFSSMNTVDLNHLHPWIHHRSFCNLRRVQPGQNPKSESIETTISVKEELNSDQI